MKARVGHSNILTLVGIQRTETRIAIVLRCTLNLKSIAPMQQSLLAHIIFLENRLQILSDELTRPELNAAERDRIGSDIASALDALAKYRDAYTIEQRLRLPRDNSGPSLPVEG